MNTMLVAQPAAAVKAPRDPCTHSPKCPKFDASDHDAAQVVAFQPEQGWSLLCNGTIVFDDEGEIHADGTTEPAHMNEPLHRIGGAR